MNYKNKKILVIDNGLFLHFAETLGQSFGTVYYFSPWVCAFPKVNTLMIGQGVTNVTRVKSIWEVYSDVDLFVFLDVGYADLQLFIESQGKRVWGSRGGEILEQDRVFAKDKAQELGINVGPYEVVNGITSLRNYLKDNDDQFVKISTLRGDAETFHSLTYEMTEPLIDKIEGVLGPKKNFTEFIVEAAIHDAVEIGYDGYTIDGEFPEIAMFGVETKGKAYFGEVIPYKKLPESVKEVNAKLFTYLQEEKYRGMFSCELRVRDDEYFFLDPCCRMPSPPGELYGAIISNWSDIIWEGSTGILVEPNYVAKYGATLSLKSDWLPDNWLPVYFPSSISEFVRLKNYCCMDDKTFVIPQNYPFKVGAVIGLGYSADDAVKNALRNAEQVNGIDIDFEEDALIDALDCFNEIKESN
jgi:hypothetical protein